MKKSLFYSLIFLFAAQMQAQEVIFDRNKFAESKRYVAHKTESPLIIDGKDDDPAWQSAQFTDNFIEIQGEIIPKFDTRVKMLWDEDYFYIYAIMDEEHIWGTLTDHDAIIFHDNDFEVFIDPEGDGRNYSELEINALNTTWDLMLDRPYRLGGKANDFFEFEGLQSAVYINGTLNDPSDVDEYWSVELAIPMESILLAKHTRKKYPSDKDIWRVNFSRVEWNHTIRDAKYERKKVNGRLAAEMNWVWSPQGEINMHIPELWGHVQFSTEAPNSFVTFEADEDEVTRQVAYQLFRRFKFAQPVQFTNIGVGNTTYMPPFSVQNQDFNVTYFKTAHGFDLLVNNLTYGKKFIIDETGELKPYRGPL